MSRESQGTIDLVHAWIEETYPTSTIPSVLFETPGEVSGFGVQYNSSVSIIYIDATEAPGWAWDLYLYSGLTIDAPGFDSPLRWANERNRNTSVGKYFAAQNRDESKSALVSGHVIRGAYFQSALVSNSGLTGHLRGMVEFPIRWADEDTGSALSLLGGRPFTADNQGVTDLFVMSSG